MTEITKVFIIIYATIQDLLPLEETNKSAYYTLVRKLIVTLLSIVVLLIIYVILIPFILLRLCIHLYLKITHGNLYGGILGGLDSIFEMYPDKTVINVINIYASKDDPSIIAKKLKGILYQIYKSSFKFSSHIRRILGYFYLVKDQVAFDEVIEIIRINDEEYMSRDMLFTYLQENCLTLERNQMWKVVIFSQPILWSKDNLCEYKQYAVIWILRHSLGDGPSIITVFQKYAIEDGPRLVETKNFVKIRNGGSKITLDNVCVRRNRFTTKLDGLALKIPGNSKWYIASFVESEPKYVQMIKEIKNEMNVSFSEVISAAITASVDEYVKQRKATLGNFSLATVIRLKTEDLLKLRNGTYKFEEIENNFGLVAFSLPLSLNGRSMKSIIQFLHQYGETLRHAVDPFIATVFLNSICSYLPINLTRTLCASFMEALTVGVTNLVGFRKSTLCGYVVDDIFFFMPSFMKTGFIFSIFSYDGRLQVILSCREGFVNNREELQQILNNVFKYIGKARDEILADSNF